MPKTLLDHAREVAEPGTDFLVIAKADCPQCKATIRRLNKYSVSYSEEPFTSITLALAKAENMTSAPVVVSLRTEEVWCGFQPKRIDDACKNR